MYVHMYVETVTLSIFDPQLLPLKIKINVFLNPKRTKIKTKM